MSEAPEDTPEDQDVRPRLVDFVRESTERLDLQPEDTAVVALALSYAARIDIAPVAEAVKVLNDLGPKLLAAMQALGATPQARALQGKKPTPDATVSPLAKLRGVS
jgi:hypothetical protein